MRTAAVLAASASVLVLACSGDTKPTIDAGVTDGTVTVDVAVEGAPADAPPEHVTSSDPCEAGTCRFASDPTGPCLPPGGPIATPDGGGLSGCCGCGNDGFCSAECVCASPDTPIATPGGERPIASIAAGDLVYSVDHGGVVAVPVVAMRRTPVQHHRVVEVRLAGGGVLRISGAHPTADGRSFADLRAGDWLGAREVVSTSVVPYEHDATYDILPDSDTGTYFADGALVGSTLARTPGARRPAAACTLPGVAAP